MAAAMKFTELGGLATGHENFLLGLGAGGSGELARLRIDGFRDNARWWFEFLRFTVYRKRDCSLHEISPHGRRRLAAGQSQVTVVVKPDPDHAQQVGGEPGEPSVA